MYMYFTENKCELFEHIIYKQGRIYYIYLAYTSLLIIRNYKKQSSYIHVCMTRKSKWGKKGCCLSVTKDYSPYHPPPPLRVYR